MRSVLDWYRCARWIGVWVVGLAAWLSACVEAPARRTAESGGAAGASLLEPSPGPLKPATGAALDGRAIGPPVVRQLGTPPTDAGDGAVPRDSAAAVGAMRTSARRPGRVGALVISELMIDPTALTDAAGEWFELHNVEADPLELQGCSVADGGGEDEVIATPLHVAASGFVTVARHEGVGFLPGAVVAFSLRNTADALELRCDGVTIDRVAYDGGLGFPIVAGAAMSLDPRSLDAESNDVAAAWCASPGAVGVDRGSPGRANPACQDDDA